MIAIVSITATTEKFAKGITQCRKLTTGFGSSIKGLVFNLKTLGAALAIGGVGLAIRVVTLDRRALREGARALRACAHASPNGQLVPLLSLLVAFAATLLAIAVIRRLPASTKELS